MIIILLYGLYYLLEYVLMNIRRLIITKYKDGIGIIMLKVFETGLLCVLLVVLCCVWVL